METRGRAFSQLKHDSQYFDAIVGVVSGCGQCVGVWSYLSVGLGVVLPDCGRSSWENRGNSACIKEILCL